MLSKLLAAARFDTIQHHDASSTMNHVSNTMDIVSSAMDIMSSTTMDVATKQGSGHVSCQEVVGCSTSSWRHSAHPAAPGTLRGSPAAHGSSRIQQGTHMTRMYGVQATYNG